MLAKEKLKHKTYLKNTSEAIIMNNKYSLASEIAKSSPRFNCVIKITKWNGI
jgi:hypothetical protein